MRAARRFPRLTLLLVLLLGLVTVPQTVVTASAAETGTFRNPLNTGPDPFVTFWNGSYYLTTTQGDSIRMWRSSSLGTLLTAAPVTVWTDTDASRNRDIWAPEFYRFGDRWYLYYTADDGIDDHHRLYVLESERDDPAGPYHFKAKLAPPNHVSDFAIDPGILQHDGRLYLAYAGINAYQHNGINIAPMSNPYTVSGDAVAIDAAGGCAEVREGPEFLNRNGSTWMTYSTCDTGKPDYQVWMMSLHEGADPPRTRQLGADLRPGVLPCGRPRCLRSRPPCLLPLPRRNGGLDRLSRQDDVGLHLHRPHHPRPEDHVEGDGSPDLGRPLAVGATQELPAGDPGSGTYWINDDGRSSGDGTLAYTGTWNSGTGCATQCFWATITGATEAATRPPGPSPEPVSLCCPCATPATASDLEHRRRFRATRRLLRRDAHRGDVAVRQPAVAPRSAHPASSGHRRAQLPVTGGVRERGPGGGVHQVTGRAP